MKDSHVLLAANVVPMLGSILAVLVWLPLLYVAPETPIWPVWQCLQTLLIALATGYVGVPLGLHLLHQGRRVAGLLCVLTSLAPYFVGTTIANWISSARHLNWVD